MSYNKERWKDFERQVAAALGGERVPVNGRRRGDTPDVRHSEFSIECKSRATVPDWLRDAVAQAKAAKRGSQLPIVIIHQVGTGHDNDIVVIPRRHFEEYYRNVILKMNDDTPLPD